MIIINVTADDIVNGIRGKCVSCPVALAISKVFPKYFVVVRNTEVHLNHSALVQTIQLPNSAVNFIDDFDNNKPVEPFSFELDYE